MPWPRDLKVLHDSMTFVVRVFFGRLLQLFRILCYEIFCIGQNFDVDFLTPACIGVNWKYVVALLADAICEGAGGAGIISPMP